MLVTSARAVRFGALALEGVRLVAIDRETVERVEGHDQGGPHCVLADSVRRRTTVRVERAAEGDASADGSAPAVGDQGLLVFHGARNGSDAGLFRAAATCVLMAVTHRLDGKPAVQTLTFVAVSADGVADPVEITSEARIEGA